jgi:hypothetical protein
MVSAKFAKDREPATGQCDRGGQARDGHFGMSFDFPGRVIFHTDFIV